ncbi:SemiSWEET transporter [Chenggangzhangella methanolivorans]|uniref:SemiSWEET transporter n=1 Tax=Chenggangzhangella methanolivorans TaxID=1437009 RepID=A0A9E6RF37_9HYPH|nr:SemiSWEET transporter [Chenggangzhangella methanolivorans]
MQSFDLVLVIGILATLCSTASFAPQAWKIIKTGDTKSLSTPMYAVTVCGFALWLAYGLARTEWPLIVTNATCLGLSAFILVMKILPSAITRRVSQTLNPKS